MLGTFKFLADAAGAPAEPLNMLGPACVLEQEQHRDLASSRQGWRGLRVRDAALSLPDLGAKCDPSADNSGDPE